MTITYKGCPKGYPGPGAGLGLGGRTITAAERAGFDLAGIGRHGDIRNARVLRFTRAVTDERWAVEPTRHELTICPWHAPTLPAVGYSFAEADQPG